MGQTIEMIEKNQEICTDMIYEDCINFDADYFIESTKDSILIITDIGVG